MSPQDEQKPCRPRARVLFKYPGGKSALVPRLLELAGGPIEGRYIDPFVGGGAVLEWVLGSGLTNRAVVWDAAVPVRQAWRAVKEAPEALSASWEALRLQYADAVAQGVGADFYYGLREQLGALIRTGGTWRDYTPATTAYLFIAYTRLCFNGVWRVNSRGEPNVAWNGQGGLTVPSAAQVRRWSTLLVETTIPGEEVTDWRDVLAGAGAGDLVYFDPPYASLPGDPAPRRGGFVQYTPTLWRPRDHGDLLAAAAAAGGRGARVLVSAPGGAFTRAAYEAAGFEVFDVGERRSVNRDGHGRGSVPCLLARWRCS